MCNFLGTFGSLWFCCFAASLEETETQFLVQSHVRKDGLKVLPGKRPLISILIASSSFLHQ